MQFVTPDKRPAVLEHQSRWSDCRLCPLCESRSKVVLWRDYVPAELVMIGEAPGFNEDSEGFPFVGRAGELLTRIFNDAMKHDGGSPPTTAITNTVCCLPPLVGKDIREPTEQEATACRPRLMEFLKLAEPNVVLLLGEIAKSTMKAINAEYRTYEMLHPAFVLRQRTMYGQYYQQSVTVMMEAINEARIPF